MKIITNHMIALRKHALAVVPKLGLKGEEVRLDQLEWKQLNALEKDLGQQARLTVDKITETTPEAEARSINDAVDCLMEIRSAIGAEKDLRNARGSREARNEEAERISRRPNPGDAEARGADDPDNFDDLDYSDFDHRHNPSDATIAYALRSSDTLVSHVTRSRQVRDQYKGLSEGAFLRSMVVGAKNQVEKRALAEGSDSAGGYTVPEILAARMIDRLRAKSAVFQAGAQTVPLFSDKNSIAKVATDPVPAWRVENAAVSESDPTFAKVELQPKSLAVLVKISRELLEDSINLENVLPEILAASLASELDRVALFGSGTAPEPRGVSNFVGLTAGMAVAGPLENYGPLLRVRTALRTANSDVSAYIMHPRDEGALAELTDNTGQPLNIPPALANVPMLTTTKMPINLGTGTDESMILAGNWSNLIVGVRTSIRIEILRERFADNLQYGFLAHLRADVAAEHEASFAKITAIKAEA
ncbi:phage major capsid protein [Brucella pituitosa]|uniref:phage major capsid protein n=1 Tax=Brucella pituitosa TaxID=571256 RepID=UPI0020056D21|nr:phage major capsid protein [Brucella pituitosa]MCK4204254.1 phage major capsid protein [Brucella pituitosa]